MVFTLSGVGWSCADDSDAAASLGVDYDKQAVVGRETNCNETPFPDGMVRVIKGGGQGIIEDRYRLVEDHAVLLDILFGLEPVPFKFHRAILRDGDFSTFNVAISDVAAMVTWQMLAQPQMRARLVCVPVREKLKPIEINLLTRAGVPLTPIAKDFVGILRTFARRVSAQR